MKPMPNIFLRKYSSSVLIGYGLAMILFALLAFFGDNSQLERVATAIALGGFFIVAGDLLSQSYPISLERYNISEETEKLCDNLRKTTNLDYHFIDGEKAIEWLDNKQEGTSNEKTVYDRKITIDKITFYIGIVFTIIGFSSLLLVMYSDFLYNLFAPDNVKPTITIISFFLLTLTLIIKEVGDTKLMEVKKDKENVIKITHRILSPEKYPEKHSDEYSNDRNKGQEKT